MRYDKNGAIVFNSATDAEDGPVAGALALCFTDMEVDINHYFNNYMYQRCANARYSVSRDQALSIFTAIYLKEKNNNNLAALVDTSRVNGNDVFIVNGGHIRICKGLRPYAYQDWLFKKSLKHAAKHDPLGEQNQMLMQLWVHPDKSLLKWYCELNLSWEQAVDEWLYDRREPELAELMISKIKDRIK